MKINQNKSHFFEEGKVCKMCDEYKSENELDLHNGEWLCNDCESMKEE